MHAVGARLEFGMELHADVERTVCKFHRFDKATVGRKPRKSKPVFRQDFTIIVVKLIAMTMAFGNFKRAVAALHRRIFFYHARIRAKS